MKRITLLLITGYKKSVSPFIDSIFGSGNTCRYSPTCSVYMYEAVEKYGTAKGLFLGLKRIGRCHPYAKGGYDPVR